MTSQDSRDPGPAERGPGALSDDGVVVGAVVETLPGKAPRVACRLGEIDGLDVVGGDGDRRLAIVWSSSSGPELERAMEQLVRTDEEILGIFPTFMGLDDKDDKGGLKARAGVLQQLTEEAGEEQGS